MVIEELDFTGCFLITPRVFNDLRGRFVKTYHEETFASAGINVAFQEEYYSLSHRGVIRGLHFQLPPHDHVKMVYCPKGSVFDAFVDVRKDSRTYLQHRNVELNEDNGSVLVLAKGIAHGFCALDDNSLMVYKTTSVYCPESDAGVLWNSCGIKWPTAANPDTLSERDKAFPALSDFDSPFVE